MHLQLTELYILDQFSVLEIWSPQHLAGQRDNRQKIPQSFKDKYPKTRVIIDGTKIKFQTLSSLVLHSETFSTYRSHSTF